MNKTLVILAAGMGSRYGGLKQIDTVGSDGESIIDFTIYDAIKSGFDRLILIIRKEHEEAFEEHLVKKIRPFINVEYAFQSLDDLPKGIEIPSERVKPWGTTHALLACRNLLKENENFVICNADDYYGKQAFEVASNYFDEKHPENEFAMVGYRIINTLSEHGTVTRALCQKDEDDHLVSIVETFDLKKKDHKAYQVSDEKEIEVDSSNLVSMNFWLFNSNIINKLKVLFEDSLEEGIKNNPLKYEALLPSDVGRLIDNKECVVKVLSSEDEWFGVTYKEDKPIVVEKFEKFKEEGIYPEKLWK